MKLNGNGKILCLSLKLLNILSFLAHAYVATRNLILKARGENVTNCAMAPWCQDRFSATIFCFCYSWYFWKE